MVLADNAGKHGRGARGAAPASDAARRGDARGTLLPARRAASCHVFFLADSRRRRSDSGRFALNRTVSGETGELIPLQQFSNASTVARMNPGHGRGGGCCCFSFFFFSFLRFVRSSFSILF